MTLKNPNLRFLLSLGDTKMVVLQDENDLHFFSNTPAQKGSRSTSRMAQHVTEALAVK